MLSNVLDHIPEIGVQGPLDWIISGAFAGIIAGIPVFRILAKWKGWLSDEA